MAREERNNETRREESKTTHSMGIQGTTNAIVGCFHESWMWSMSEDDFLFRDLVTKTKKERVSARLEVKDEDRKTHILTLSFVPPNKPFRQLQPSFMAHPICPSLRTRLRSFDRSDVVAEQKDEKSSRADASVCSFSTSVRARREEKTDLSPKSFQLMICTSSGFIARICSHRVAYRLSSDASDPRRKKELGESAF